MVRLIALDLDGTLLDPRGQVSPAALAAIRAARARGVRVVLATGRSIQEVAWFSRLAGTDEAGIALGGAALVDVPLGRSFWRQDLPRESGRQALALCLGREIKLMIFAGESILLDPFSQERLARSFPSPEFHRRAVVTADPLGYLAEHRLPLTKLHGDGGAGRYPLDALGALEGVSLTTSGPTDFELVPAGVDKGEALARLCRMWDIPLGECAGVGDSENDLPLLSRVGYPVAMENGDRRLFALRGVLRAPSNRADGAAWAISRLLELP